jgi:choline kinase
MKCLIIAAGKGSRLANKGDSKPLIKLNGIPLIERVITIVLSAGVSDFYVVTGYNSEKIRQYLHSFPQKHSLNLNFIHNVLWEKENGISVLCARDKIKEPFFLLMSDHLFDPAIIKELQMDGIGPEEIKLAVDRRITDNPMVDLEDVTKVWEQDGRILDIGKGIGHFNAFDTGIFFCQPAIFDALEHSINDGDSSLSGGIRKMARKGHACTFGIGNRFWIDVDDETAFKKAENFLKNNP